MYSQAAERTIQKQMREEVETPQGAIHFPFYAQPKQEWKKKPSTAPHWELRTQPSPHDQTQQEKTTKAWTS
jgi:hypothetical protein